MSARDVIANASKQGMKLDEPYVYKIRRGTRRKAEGVGKAAGAPASRAPAEADFVRSRPYLSASEIVEDAKAAGLDLDVRYVRGLRGSRGASPRAENPARPPDPSSLESLLRAIAAELGLGRAIEILGAERARVQALLRG